MFHLDIVYLCNCFQMFLGVFASVLYICLSVLFVFFCMLQILYLNVSKIDQVLHMECACKADDGTGNVRGGVGYVRGDVGLLLGRVRTSPQIIRSDAGKSLSVYTTYFLQLSMDPRITKLDAVKQASV
jgi:hypothetical protein